ncbi:MAG: Crp/Fnr family transcriptional regulator [Sphingomonas sp.]
MPLNPFVKKLRFWLPLDDDNKEAILALPHSVREMQPGQMMVWEGERPTHSCVLLSGYAYRQKSAGNGGRQILSIHMQGDPVDLHNSLLGRADHNVQALTQVRAAFIPVGAIRALWLSHPAAAMAMWYDTLVDGSVFREWTLNIGRRDARTRLAHLLCEFAVRLEAAGLGDHSHYELPMTQEQLADATGLTSVHVNRTLMKLEADGLILRTKRSVRINDWEQLALAGDFDPAYLHLDKHSDDATSPWSLETRAPFA